MTELGIKQIEKTKQAKGLGKGAGDAAGLFYFQRLKMTEFV